MTVALLGVPYDGSSSARRGTADAPAAIREALGRMVEYSNRFSESGLNLDDPGVLRDAGDVRCGESASARAAIEAAVTGLLALGERPLILGGDHSISYPALRAVCAGHGPVDVLHFDAHPDLYPEFQGDRYSHACPFARALEEGLIGKLVQVGIRAATPPQRAVAEQYHVETVPRSDWIQPPALRFEQPVYVSLDLDGLDPAFAPGVSHPEPGGLSVGEVVSFLHRVQGTAVGADLVEYNPALDPEGRTGVVCTKLVKELVALLS